MADETNPETTAVATQPKRLVDKFSPGAGVGIGLPKPEEMEYMMSVARHLSRSALIGKDMGLSADQIARYKSMGVSADEIARQDIETVASNAFAKMLVGIEFKPPIPPMAAQNELYIVKGKIFVAYPALIAQIEFKGYEIVEEERTHERAAITLKMKGRPDRQMAFTIEDAKKAGLTSSEQYQKRPRVMLWSRLISEAYRVTGGRADTYTPEERHEILSGDDDVNGSDRKDENPFTVGEKPEPTVTRVAEEPTAPAPAAAAPTPIDRKKADTAAAAPEPAKPEPAKSEPAPAPAAKPESATAAPPAATPEPPAARTEAPAPAAAPAADTPLGKLKQAFQSLILLAEGHNPTKVQAAVTKFLAEFFGAKQIPKDLAVEEYAKPMRFAQAIIPAHTEAFMKEPGVMGAKIRASFASYNASVKSWDLSTRCEALAFDLIFAFDHAASGGTDTAEYLVEQGIQKMKEPDAYAFLLVASRVPQSAYKLLDLSGELNKLPSEIVAGWGIDVATAPAAGIEALLGGGEPAKPAADAAVAGDDAEQGGLLDFLDVPGEGYPD